MTRISKVSLFHLFSSFFTSIAANRDYKNLDYEYLNYEFLEYKYLNYEYRKYEYLEYDNKKIWKSK